jgi:hypothetical protein
MNFEYDSGCLKSGAKLTLLHTLPREFSIIVHIEALTTLRIALVTYRSEALQGLS